MGFNSVFKGLMPNHATHYGIFYSGVLVST